MTRQHAQIACVQPVNAHTAKEKHLQKNGLNSFLGQKFRYTQGKLKEKRHRKQGKKICVSTPSEKRQLRTTRVFAHETQQYCVFEKSLILAVRKRQCYKLYEQKNDDSKVENLNF